jgi:hypothetical protein
VLAGFSIHLPSKVPILLAAVDVGVSCLCIIAPGLILRIASLTTSAFYQNLIHSRSG